MIHLGDITKLDGAKIPVVDVITGGSPCQDLSVAGKRAGLAGKRSGLFMEQMRIVKEMRANDRLRGRSGFLVRPRYMWWENVPGAFSSGRPKGADFAAVIEEIVKIVCEEVPAVHVPEKGWPGAGCFSGMGDGGVPFSVAWRVHDAQFWGVPQRRKRISLVADFGGLSAPEVLFERQGLRGYPPEGGETREGAAAGVEGGAGSAICLQGNGIDRADTAGCNGRGWCEDVSYTLNTIDRPAVYPLVANTLSARYDGSPQPDKGNGANIVCAGFKAGQETAAGTASGAGGAVRALSFQERAGKPGGGKGILIQDEHVGALSTLTNQSVFAVGINQRGGKGNASYTKDVAPTLAGDSHGTPHAISFHLTQDPIPQTGATPCLSQSVEPILLESNQNHATVQTDGISTALPASMGMGGGYIPMIVKTLDTADRHAVTTFAQNQRDEVRDLKDVAGALPAEPGMKQQTFVYEQHSQDSRYKPLGDVCETVNAKYGTGGNNMPMVVEPLCIGNGQLCNMAYKPIANTLDTMHDQQAVITFDKEMYNAGEKMTGEMQARYDDVAPTVRADSHPSGVCTSVVRRLTPLECERLQGYPDGWTDIGDWTDSKGKKHKAADSPRYKALGNSIALPFWAWLARRICAQYERPMTMGSLFDGIGGFPLVFARAGARAVWASEIEEFPIAVTKLRFPEVTTGSTLRGEDDA